MHDFKQSLARSDAWTAEGWWEDFYRQAFPKHFKAMHTVTFERYPEMQRRGVDRVIVLAGGERDHTVSVDEKVRAGLWPDVLLEIWSNYERKVRGWACKEQHCDFIAYVFPEAQRGHLLPFVLLQRALRVNWSAWKAAADDGVGGFGWCDAANDGYTTRSLIVPDGELISAITFATQVSW